MRQYLLFCLFLCAYCANINVQVYIGEIDRYQA